MERYLPLQYCVDIQSEANELNKNELEGFFEAFSNRDFGSYPYSFSNKHYANYSQQILMSAQKPRMVEGVLQPLEVALLLELWGRTKQVYEPDSEFSSVLMNTNSIKVYPDFIRRLPFRDFYIDLSNNKALIAEGIFVSVRVYENDEIRIMYMIADKKKRIKFVDIFDFTPEEHPMESLEKMISLSSQQNQIMMMDRQIIKQRGGLLSDKRICTGENYVFGQYNSSYYLFNKSMCPEVYQGHNYCYIEINKIAPEDSIGDIAVFILQFILYLSSKKPNITESETTKSTYRPYKQPENKFSQIRKWDVELYYGERIRILEEKRKQSSEHKGGTHRSPRPHTRCGYSKGCWCGSGKNKHLEPRWIEATYVNGTYKDIIVKSNETSL